MGKAKKKVLEYTGLQVVASSGRLDSFVGDHHWFCVDEEDGFLYVFDDPDLDAGGGFIAAYAPRTWDSVRLVS